MTSKPVAGLVSDLGLPKIHSRPHVSDANAFSERQLEALKYRLELPIEDAYSSCWAVFYWYNEGYLHTGIGLLTSSSCSVRAVHFSYSCPEVL